MNKNDIRLIGVEVITPYQLLSSSSLYQIPPPQMLIEGVIPKQSITGVTSYPGVGKTWFALEMARAEASGELFLGKFEVNEPGAVLFVGSDASEFDYADQWRRISKTTWAKYIPTEEETQAEGFIEPINPLEEHASFLLQSDFLFENLDSVRRLINTSLTHTYGKPHLVGEGADAKYEYESGFKLIVFDTLSKLTRANQNDNTEMEEVFRNIRLITETTGAAVLILHHNSKRNEFNGGDDWRGAMAQIGALDGWLNVSKPYKDKDKVKVEVKKFRGRQPKPFAYKMDVNGELEAHLAACELEADKPAKQEVGQTPVAIIMPDTVEVEVGSTVPDFVLHLLASHSMTVQQIQTEVLLKFNDEPEEVVKNRISEALSRLKKKGTVMRDAKSKHYMLSGVVSAAVRPEAAR